MEPMHTFRCTNGDYVLVPASSAPVFTDADGVTCQLLGKVTCSHLDDEVRSEIAEQLTTHGFARITRAKFFAAASVDQA